MYRVRHGYLRILIWHQAPRGGRREVGLVSLEKGHLKVSYLLRLVTTMRWSKEERALAVEAHFLNGRSIIATQRAFRTRFNICTGAPLPGR